MGALIAGLFGMNVSRVLYRPPPGYPSSDGPLCSLRATWKNIRTPLQGCLWHPPSSRSWLHGLAFEGRFLVTDFLLPLTRHRLGWQRSKRLASRHPTAGEALAGCHFQCAKGARKADLDTFTLRYLSPATNLDNITCV
jgi:hypothetical protein